MRDDTAELPAKLARPHNLQELARVYGVCRKTIKKWLAPFEQQIGPRIGRYYSVRQVEIIVAMLGLPADEEEENHEK